MVSSIIEAIDKQIAQLQQARSLLEQTSHPLAQTGAVRRGRPEGSKNKVSQAAVRATRRKMSEEGRARIAAAQKKRHAARKRAARSAAREAVQNG